MKVVELYYSVGQVAFLLAMSESWVRGRVRAGAFGDGVLDLESDVRIPASGVNAYVSAHKRQYSEPIRARNRAELLRKVGKA